MYRIDTEIVNRCSGQRYATFQQIQSGLYPPDLGFKTGDLVVDMNGYIYVVDYVLSTVTPNMNHQTLTNSNGKIQELNNEMYTDCYGLWQVNNLPNVTVIPSALFCTRVASKMGKCYKRSGVRKTFSVLRVRLFQKSDIKFNYNSVIMTAHSVEDNLNELVKIYA